MGSAIKKISDKVTAVLVNRELNKVKAEVRDALKKAKDNPESSNIATIVLKRGLIGLRADLGELKIDQAEWASYESIYRKRFMMATKGLEDQAVFGSMEAKKLDAFINDYASYTKLDEVIAECKKRDSSDPLKRIVQIARANAPLLSGLTAGFMSLFDEKDKAKKGKPSKLDQAAAKADAVLSKGKKKKETKDENEECVETPESGGYCSGRSQNAEAGPMGTGTKVESVGSVKYEINPDHTAKKLSKKEFRKKYLSIKNRKKRNTFVLAQVAAGNASNAFEKLRITSKDSKMSVVMEVDRHGMRVAGTDIQMDGPTAMAAAMLSSCTLPTPWISDQIYKAAKANKGNIPFIAAPAIAKDMEIDWQAMSRNDRDIMRMSGKFAVARAKLLDAYRKKHKIKNDKLTAGQSKDIVHPVPGETKKGMLEIYGGYYSTGQRVQPVSGGFHGPTYSDYSHQLRRVRNTPKSVTVTENGKEKKMSLTEFYANKKYAEKFGFKAQKLGNPYITPELQAFVDKKKQKGKTKTPNLEAIAAADKQKGKKPKKNKPS